MAQGKKTVVVYTDWGDIFEKLDDVEAGKLIKHFFAYVRDKNPEPPDRITELLFQPIKNTLKRDLKRWEGTVEVKSMSGRMGNLKRWHPDLYQKVVNKELGIDEAEVIAEGRKGSQIIADATKSSQKIADSVSDSVSDNKKKIDIRKLKFADTLKPFFKSTENPKGLYTREFLNEFYAYWTEPNKSGTKFRAELERTWDVGRRLATWAKNDKNFIKTDTKTTPAVATAPAAQPIDR